MRCRGLGLIVCLIGVCELTGCGSGPSRGLFVRNSRTPTNKDRARAAQEPTDLTGKDADLAKHDETSGGRTENDPKLSRAERDQPTKRPLRELPDDLPARAERHPRTPTDDSGPANNTLELVDGLTSIDHRIDETEPSGGQFDVSGGATRDNGFAAIEAPAPKRRSSSSSGAADHFPSSIDAVPTTDRSVVPAEFLSDSASSGVVPVGGVRSTTRTQPWPGNNAGSAFSQTIFDVDSANGLAPRMNAVGPRPSTWTELPGQRPETNAPSSGSSTPDPWPRLPAASATTPAFANPATNVQLAGTDQSHPNPGVIPGLNFPTTTGQFRPSPPNVPVLTNIPAGAPLAIAPFVTAPELERLITQTAVESAMMTPGETESERQAFLRKHVQLRLLHLIDGQMDRALQPVPGIDPADQEFWQQMLWGIANYFDTQGMPDSAERATQTIAQLQAASLRLQVKARLELKNLAFCQKITSFGIYQRFRRDQFTPGQPVLLYAEAANFKSEPSSDGQFRTLMKSTIDIHEGAPQGRILESIPFKPSEDRCRNHRRDYFHSYEFAIPQGINPGPHVLRLTVEDQLGRKTASATMNFTVE